MVAKFSFPRRFLKKYIYIILMSLTYSDVCLPGEGSESGLVAADDPTLGDVPARRVEAAAVVVGDGAELDVGPPLVVLQAQGESRVFCQRGECGTVQGMWDSARSGYACRG